jgi:hypothetical protein
VIGVLIASTVLFALWWKFRQSPLMPQNWAGEAAARKEEIQKKALEGFPCDQSAGFMSSLPQKKRMRVR